MSVQIPYQFFRSKLTNQKKQPESAAVFFTIAQSRALSRERRVSKFQGSIVGVLN